MIGLLHIFVSSKVGFARRDREGLLIFKALGLERDTNTALAGLFGAMLCDSAFVWSFEVPRSLRSQAPLKAMGHLGNLLSYVPRSVQGFH